MAVTREQIEAAYSRIPLVRPPKNILLIRNAEIGADRLFQAAHAMNAEQARQWHILGLHKMGTDNVVVAGDAGPSTPVHEGIHYNGVRNETLTRLITRVAQARIRFNLGLFQRPVHYREELLGPQETAQVLNDLHLSNPTGGDVQLVRLVYTP